ncbi:MAG: quinol oxidase [Nevskiales bacterium]
MPQQSLITVARVLIASVFIVIGGERLLIGFGLLHYGSDFSAVVLIISALEVLAGLLIALGWQLRILSAIMALLMLADAIGSHPFWAVEAAQVHDQLLHFAKNMAIVGAFLLLVGMDSKNPDPRKQAD